MRNFKHSLAAILAVVMISSMAAVQVADISAVKANKMDDDNGYLSVSDANNTNQEAIKLDEGNAPVPVDFRTYNLDIENETFEELRPFRPVAGYVITTTGGLNIRTGPSLESEILESITYGQMIDIIDEDGDWYVIPYGTDGTVGYVLKEYVTTSYEEAKSILLESVMYETGVVTVDGSALNIRSGAGTDNTVIIDQVADGDPVIVLDRVENDWLKVYYGTNYDVGYVTSQYVNLGGMVSREEVSKKRIERIDAISKDGIITTSKSVIECKKMPTEDSSVLRTFQKGDTCYILKTGSEWTKIAYGANRATGYVKSEDVMTKAAYDNQNKKKSTAKAATGATTSTNVNSNASTNTNVNANPASSSKGQAIVNTASKYIGVKYVYGGTSPSGFDCSGLVQYVCREVGISVNRTSRAQYSNGDAVSKSNLQPGDLVFFSKGSGISHVGIYAGSGQVIHAPSPGKRVCYIPLSTICGYSTYVGARRVY